MLLIMRLLYQESGRLSSLSFDGVDEWWITLPSSEVDSSSEGEIGFEKCTGPSIGPLPAAILVHDPDRSIVGRGVDHRDISCPSIAFDGEGVGLEVVDMVRVVHASIVPEEEEKGKRSGGELFNNSGSESSLGDTDF